jgi:hypothetical protein
MDMIKLLLAATLALILGALAVSWQDMKNGVKNTSSDEVARLENQIKEIRAEQDKLAVERQLQQLKNDPVASQTASSAEIEAMKLQVAASKEALERLATENAARDQKVAQDEEGLLGTRALESSDSELRRARRITNALLMGRVKEYAESADVGGFVIIEVLMPEQVIVGSVLAIRRKTGILGQFKITDVTPEGAIGNPMPGFGPVKPIPGDELIFPPQN